MDVQLQETPHNRSFVASQLCDQAALAFDRMPFAINPRKCLPHEIGGDLMCRPRDVQFFSHRARIGLSHDWQ